MAKIKVFTSVCLGNECSYYYCTENSGCLKDRSPHLFENENLVRANKKPNRKSKWYTPRPRKKKVKNPSRVDKLIALGHKPECACCSSSKRLTFDHVIPTAKNGPNTLKNGQILCFKCNNIKGDLLVDLFQLADMVRNPVVRKKYYDEERVRKKMEETIIN